MKAKDLISRVIDNYQKIKISEIHGLELTGEEWTIYPHSMNYENIPEHLLNKEIYAIALYYDGLYITVRDK